MIMRKYIGVVILRRKATECTILTKIRRKTLAVCLRFPGRYIVADRTALESAPMSVLTCEVNDIDLDALVMALQESRANAVLVRKGDICVMGFGKPVVWVLLH